MDHVRKLRENPGIEQEVLEAERNELDILKDALNEACNAYESLGKTLTGGMMSEIGNLPNKE